MINKFSFSQVILAVAIAYFAYALLTFTKEIPRFIEAVDRVTPQIDAIINEVELVRAEVTEVRTSVDKEMPAILLQVKSIVPLVEQGLTQSNNYAKQLPELWRHLDEIEAHIQLFQQNLPTMLQRIDAMVVTTNKTVDELKQWRPHSTQYLQEIENSRQDIPQYLTRIEGIVSDAKTVGKEASSGLVTGFFKGVISLPFEVVSGLAGIVDAKSRSAKFLTAKDVTIMQQQVLVLLANKAKKQIFWQNIDSGNRGKIVKDYKFTKHDQSCHNLTFVNYFNDQQETLTELMCQDEDGLWQVM